MDYKYIIIRPKDTVEVIIMPHKNSGKYSFVNITKNHICPCLFDSLEDAIKDIEKLKLEGKIIDYYPIGKERKSF